MLARLYEKPTKEMRNMATLREGGPYIWPTWLSKLLSGENSCHFAAWFKAQHDSRSWEKMPSSGDMAQWQLNHTEMLNSIADQYRQEGWDVTVEGQNSFSLQGRAATVGGKPDVIAVKDTTG